MSVGPNCPTVVRMAQRTEVPTRDQALEELDRIGVDDTEATDRTEPAETPEEATPPAGTEAPAEGADQPVNEEATQEEVDADRQPSDGQRPPASPAAPAAWQPPPGGKPFRFRADHREVEVPGAQEWDHGIYVPREAWNGVVSRHLADRDQLYQVFQAQQREIEARDPSRNEIVLQAQATLQKFQELMDQGPAAVAQWLDNFTVNRPKLEAEIQAETYRRQLESQQQQVSQVQQQEQTQYLAAQLPGYIESNIADLVSRVPELQILKGSEHQLVEALWPVAKAFLYEENQTIYANPQALQHLLKQEADRRAEVKRLQEAQKHNGRVLGNGTPPPKTVPTRGRPTPAGKRDQKPVSAQAARNAYLEADLAGD